MATKSSDLGKIYRVYDHKAAAYAPLFCARNNAVAMRIFEQSAQDPNTQLHKYPEDFTLWLVGEEDDQSGVIHPWPSGPELICRASDFKDIE